MVDTLPMMVDSQRQAISDAITAERLAVLDAITAERIAILDELRDAALDRGADAIVVLGFDRTDDLPPRFHPWSAPRWAEYEARSLPLGARRRQARDAYRTQCSMSPGRWQACVPRRSCCRTTWAFPARRGTTRSAAPTAAWAGSRQDTTLPAA